MLLHTKNKWFQRRRFFNVSPKISLVKLLIHRVWPVLIPGALLVGFM